MFLAEASKRGAFQRAKKMPKHRINESSGVRGVRYQIRLLHKKVSIEAYIDLKDSKGCKTHELFRRLFNRHGVIEQGLGAKLIWSCPKNQRARVIAWTFAGWGVQNERCRWPQLCTEMLAAYTKFCAVLGPELVALDTATPNAWLESSASVRSW
jgi:hypothetical protein